MKLTKNEIQKISDLYNLGKIRKSRLIKKGLDNHNFVLQTSQGKFVIRILGRKLDDWKKEKINLEFRVLNFLKENKFPYKTPNPIKNKNRDFILNLNKKSLWIYEMIEGESVKNWPLNSIQIGEIAKALAIYHKTIKNFKVEKNKEEGFIWWISEGFSKIKKVKPKNRVDRLALDNVGYFESILNQILKKRCKENLLINHRDFHASNLLFKKEKIIAIIDFDNIDTRPRVNDIATSIKDECFTNQKFNKEKMKVFLTHYEKINKLTKKEKEVIPYYMLMECCAVFRWFYDGMKKETDKKFKFMKNTIKESESLINELKLDIK